MKSIQLSPSDQLYHQATHKVIITYADLTSRAGATDTSVVVELLPDTAKYTGATLPAGTQVECTKAQIVTVFDNSETAVNAMSCEVGITGGDIDSLLDGFACFTADNFGTEAPTTSPIVLASADTVDAIFTASGGSSNYIDATTQGELHLYFKVTTPTTDMKGVTDSLTVA